MVGKSPQLPPLFTVSAFRSQRGFQSTLPACIEIHLDTTARILLVTLYLCINTWNLLAEMRMERTMASSSFKNYLPTDMSTMPRPRGAYWTSCVAACQVPARTWLVAPFFAMDPSMHTKRAPKPNWHVLWGGNASQVTSPSILLPDNPITLKMHMIRTRLGNYRIRLTIGWGCSAVLPKSRRS